MNQNNNTNTGSSNMYQGNNNFSSNQNNMGNPNNMNNQNNMNNMNGQNNMNNYNNNQMVNNQVPSYNQMANNNQGTNNQQMATIKPGDSKNNKPFVVKKKSGKLFLLVIIGVAAFLGIGFFITNKGHGIIGNNKQNGDEKAKLKIDTGKKWGDKYASYLYENYDSLNEYNVAFIDFVFDETPEMVIKYQDAQKKDTLRIFKIDNNEISETKEFRNADFKMLYSFREKEVKWYLYINSATSKKYGTYTLLEKIIKGKAMSADISATTDVEISTFNINYVMSNYKPTYYGIKKESFEKDFKTAVLKYDSFNKDAQSAKTNLLNDYGNIEYEEEIDENPTFRAGSYELAYGDYSTVIDVYKNGQIVDTEEKIVSIKPNGTIVDGEEVIEFDVFGEKISLKNGMSITVTDNNTFVYGIGEGRTYTLKS